MPWEEGAWPRIPRPCQVGGVGMVQSAQVAGGGRPLAHSPSRGPDPLEVPSPGAGWWGPSRLPLRGLRPRDALERVALAPTIYSVSLHGVSWPQSRALWPGTPGFWALGPLAWPSGCQNCLHHKEQLLPRAPPPLGAGGCLGGPGSFPPRLRPWLLLPVTPWLGMQTLPQILRAPRLCGRQGGGLLSVRVRAFVWLYFWAAAGKTQVALG